jgi:ribonuclease P protein component
MLPRDWRLHNRDYQRVYQASRKQFSTSMTYSWRHNGAARAPGRVWGLPGKVLGKAVERNRIKRRMRAAIVSNLDALDAQVDVVLHPKRGCLTANWQALRNEVRRVFVKVKRAKGMTCQSAAARSVRHDTMAALVYKHGVSPVLHAATDDRGVPLSADVLGVCGAGCYVQAVAWELAGGRSTALPSTCRADLTRCRELATHGVKAGASQEIQ